MMLAFIVDGQMEKLILHKLCGKGKVPIVMRNYNGRSVGVDALCIDIKSHYRQLRAKWNCLVVIIVDREDRESSAFNIEEAIKSALRAEGEADQHFIVSCADQMIENWILAGGGNLFPENIADLGDDMDGCNGKSKIKRIMKARNDTYDEVTDGPDLFVSMSHAEAAAKSPSFRRLFDALTGHCPKFRYAATAAQFASSESA